MKTLRITLLLSFFLTIGINAQEKVSEATEAPKEQASEAEAIAKKLANPISSLISIPFQNNTDFGIGNYNGTRNTLNFQPVIPLKLSSNLNLITRVIVPIVSQYDITGTGTCESGISNVTASAFFSPSAVKNGLIWGAGPAFLLPTSNEYLGTLKTGVGPTFIILKQAKGFTYGMLANQLWSIAGPSDVADISTMYLQGFLVYNWKTGAGVGLSSENTFNWEANSTSSYLVPTVTGVTKLGKQMVQLQIGPRIPFIFSNSEQRSDLGIRASVVFVFPK
jgi:hypothetical protein